MRVLFYTTFEASPHKGGTERITTSISNGLRRYWGYKCYSAYLVKIDVKFERTQFDGYVHLRKKDFVEKLREFVINNEIDVIINQGDLEAVPKMRKAIEGLYGKHLILVHHFNPGAEEHFLNFKNLYFEVRHRPYKIKSIIKLCLYPIVKRRYEKKIKMDYKLGYDSSDLVVLISQRFKHDFMKYGNISDDSKIRVIHNSLSYDSFFNMELYHEKEKEVLIVSRLDEEQKRISLALKIWEQIEMDSNYSDWRLTIVGHGEMDEPKYKRFVKTHKLSRVSFEGMQEPSVYYKRASLFMMTSLFEGWGLTLTESQQFGCIPLAFGSYASLPDIITDGENGYVIDEGKNAEYVQRMKSLMDDKKKRDSMASKCIESSHRFENAKIVEEWHKLISSLNNKNNISCEIQVHLPQYSR